MICRRKRDHQFLTPRGWMVGTGYMLGHVGGWAALHLPMKSGKVFEGTKFPRQTGSVRLLSPHIRLLKRELFTTLVNIESSDLDPKMQTSEDQTSLEWIKQSWALVP